MVGTRGGARRPVAAMGEKEVEKNKVGNTAKGGVTAGGRGSGQKAEEPSSPIAYVSRHPGRGQRYVLFVDSSAAVIGCQAYTGERLDSATHHVLPRIPLARLASGNCCEANS